MLYLSKFVRSNTLVLSVIGIGFFWGVMILIVTNVVSRRISYPILGTYELAGLLMAIAAVPALSYAELKKSHVSVTILEDHLNTKNKMILGVFLSLITLFSLALLFLGSTKTIIQNWSLGEASEILRFPVIPIRIFFVYGLLSWCLVIILNLIENMKEKGKK